jgi:uncharacterized protein (DUF983 family)
MYFTNFLYRTLNFLYVLILMIVVVTLLFLQSVKDSIVAIFKRFQSDKKRDKEISIQKS